MSVKSLNCSARVAISLFCVSVLMGLGYALLAITMSITGGKTLIPPIDQVQQKYAGIMIVSAMKGSMYDHVSEDESIDVVREWVEAGAPEEVYNEKIAPILEEDCTDCHSTTSTMTDAKQDLPLTSYEEVLKVTERGQPWSKLAVQSHTHMFAIGTLVLAMSLLMAHASVLNGLKTLLIVLASLGLWGDVLSWTLAKYISVVGYLVPFTGAALIGSLGLMAVIVLLDCWIRVPLVGQNR